jgi:hypothetical protein
MTAILANASAKDRPATDFYPTPPEVTAALMRFLALPPCLIWEPACGNGAMAEEMMRHGHEVLSSDIHSEGFGGCDIDFLAPDLLCDKLVRAIITNPPFIYAEAFIRKAVPLAPTVAMLLKSQYWHASKRAKLFDDLPPAYVLPLTWRPDFLAGAKGGAPTMDCLWTVWIDGQTNTQYRLLKKDGAQK